MKGKTFSSFMVWMCIFLLALFMVSVIFEQYEAKTLLIVSVAGVLTVVGAYLALDFRAIIKMTAAKPAGKFAVADKWKYIRMIIGMFGLLLIGIVMQTVTAQNYETVLAVLAGAFLGTVAVYISGMKQNKIASS